MSAVVIAGKLREVQVLVVPQTTVRDTNRVHIDIGVVVDAVDNIIEPSPLAITPILSKHSNSDVGRVIAGLKVALRGLGRLNELGADPVESIGIGGEVITTVRALNGITRDRSVYVNTALLANRNWVASRMVHIDFCESIGCCWCGHRSTKGTSGKKSCEDKDFREHLEG